MKDKCFKEVFCDSAIRLLTFWPIFTPLTWVEYGGEKHNSWFCSLKKPLFKRVAIKVLSEYILPKCVHFTGIKSSKVKLPAKPRGLRGLLGEKSCRDGVKSVISNPYDFRFLGNN